MKSLLNICTGFLCNYLEYYTNELPFLPPNCKQAILEWLVAHDCLCNVAAKGLLALDDGFMGDLTKISFQLSEQLNDVHLEFIGRVNKHLTHISLVHCDLITEHGLKSLLKGQKCLESVELVSLQGLTMNVFASLESPILTSVDLSGSISVNSDCITKLLSKNTAVRRLYLNNCTALDDAAIYSIGNFLGNNLEILELNFVTGLEDPAAAIEHLAERCPNLRRLSLCRYYDPDRASLPQVFYKLSSGTLRELDLYGNFFSTLPQLPTNITKLRLSCSGDEDAQDLCHQLSTLPNLNSIFLTLCPHESVDEIKKAVRFLIYVLKKVGDKITGLAVHAHRIPEPCISLISKLAPHVRHLALDTESFSNKALFAFVHGDSKRAARMRSLRISKAPVNYRVLFAIARRCHNLRELELSHVDAVDNHFIKILTLNNNGCLSSVNFNGCCKVTDEGLCKLARKCPLRELRIRATGASDKCVYCLAQCCSKTLEWIAHADYTGRPTFSEEALGELRNSCVLRVIC